MLDCYKRLAEMKLRRVFWLHAIKNLLFAAVQIWLFHFFDCHLFSIIVLSNWYYSLKIDLLSRMELYEERYRTRDLPLKERLENASFEAGTWRLTYGDLLGGCRIEWMVCYVFPLLYKIFASFLRLLPAPLSQFTIWGALILCTIAAVCLNIELNKMLLDVVERLQEDEDATFGLEEMDY